MKTLRFEIKKLYLKIFLYNHLTYTSKSQGLLFLTMHELRWLGLFPLGLAVLMLTSLECMRGFLLF